MFVRTATRRNKDGTAVRYLQLVHNEWDPATKSAKMRVLHNFGREDQVDKAAIERLAGSLCRLLEPGRAAALRTPALAYCGSVAYGGPWLLDQLWRRLGIGAILTARLARTRRDPSAERVLFALVANRALDPSSKLAAAHWAGRKAWIDGPPVTTDDACYRAMDWLMQVRDALEREVFAQVANLLNLEVDLLFFDTTSTCFELDEEDEPVPRDKHGNITNGSRSPAASVITRWCRCALAVCGRWSHPGLTGTYRGGCSAATGAAAPIELPLPVGVVPAAVRAAAPGRRLTDPRPG